ncbi:uncharacterized protein [Danio rerio]|uniref:Uncharacterized protein n=1 Tax=Danio rerio TaxID=7955 RepID=A0AC58HE85_DANRE
MLRVGDSFPRHRWIRRRSRPQQARCRAGGTGWVRVRKNPEVGLSPSPVMHGPSTSTARHARGVRVGRTDPNDIEKGQRQPATQPSCCEKITHQVLVGDSFPRHRWIRRRSRPQQARCRAGGTGWVRVRKNPEVGLSPSPVMHGPSTSTARHARGVRVGRTDPNDIEKGQRQPATQPSCCEKITHQVLVGDSFPRHRWIRRRSRPQQARCRAGGTGWVRVRKNPEVGLSPSPVMHGPSTSTARHARGVRVGRTDPNDIEKGQRQPATQPSCCEKITHQVLVGDSFPRHRWIRRRSRPQQARCRAGGTGWVRVRKNPEVGLSPSPVMHGPSTSTARHARGVRVGRTDPNDIEKGQRQPATQPSCCEKITHQVLVGDSFPRHRWIRRRSRPQQARCRAGGTGWVRVRKNPEVGLSPSPVMHGPSTSTARHARGVRVGRTDPNDIEKGQRQPATQPSCCEKITHQVLVGDSFPRHRWIRRRSRPQQARCRAGGTGWVRVRKNPEVGLSPSPVMHGPSTSTARHARGVRVGRTDPNDIEKGQRQPATQPSCCEKITHQVLVGDSFPRHRWIRRRSRPQQARCRAGGTGWVRVRKNPEVGLSPSPVMHGPSTSTARHARGVRVGRTDPNDIEKGQRQPATQPSCCEKITHQVLVGDSFPRHRWIRRRSRPQQARCRAGGTGWVRVRKNPEVGLSPSPVMHGPSTSTARHARGVRVGRTDPNDIEKGQRQPATQPSCCEKITHQVLVGDSFPRHRWIRRRSRPQQARCRAGGTGWVRVRKNPEVGLSPSPVMHGPSTSTARHARGVRVGRTDPNDIEKGQRQPATQPSCCEKITHQVLVGDSFPRHRWIRRRSRPQQARCRAGGTGWVRVRKNPEVGLSPSPVMHGPSTSTARHARGVRVGRTDPNDIEKGQRQPATQPSCCEKITHQVLGMCVTLIQRLGRVRGLRVPGLRALGTWVKF